MSAARTLRAQPIGTADERDLARRLAEIFLLRLPKSVRREDIHQAALIGLWDGLRKHDGTGTAEQRKGYLITRIRGRITDELRAQDWLPRRSRLAQASPERAVTIVRFDDLGRSDEQLNWEEHLPAQGNSALERLVLDATVNRALGALDARKLKVVRQHYARDIRFSDIAQGLGVSEPRISQLHTRALRDMRARLTEEEDDHRAVDRRTREPADAPARPGPHPLAVPKRWLGGSPAPAAGRPVPGRAGGRELAREALPRLCLARPGAVVAGAAADRGGGLAVSEAPAVAVAEPVTEPVPSVLPEEGVQLDAELLRYRDWMIGQALLRTSGSRAAAARLLGINRTTLVEILKRSERTESKAALADQLPEVDRRLVELAARIPWDRVAQMRAEGAKDCHIARRLAFSLDTHRYTIEKALRLPRPIAKCGP